MPLALTHKALAALKFIVSTGCILALPCAAQQGLDQALLAGTCVTCHGPGGRPPAGATGGIPTLRGQSSAALLARMQAFKAGSVAGATVMPLLMQGYDAAQMQALADWFADPKTLVDRP